jgi:hypothetical protein
MRPRRDPVVVGFAPLFVRQRFASLACTCALRGTSQSGPASIDAQLLTDLMVVRGANWLGYASRGRRGRSSEPSLSHHYARFS